MNLLRLSIRSVIRKPVRSILLLALVLVVSSFLYAGWSCRSAGVITQNNSKKAMDAGFRLEEDAGNSQKRRNAAIEKMGMNVEGSVDGVHADQLENGDWHVWTDHSFDTLRMPDIRKIARMPGIASYNVTTAPTAANPVNFKRIEDPKADQHSDLQCVTLRGNLNMADDFDVRRGNIEVTAGRLITKSDKDCCVISKEIADLNNLKVGDKLDFNSRKDRKKSKVYSAAVVGIYTTKQKMTQIQSGDTYRSENVIFTDLRYPEKPEGSIGDPFFECATFQVADVDRYRQMENKIRSVDINWERYDLLDDSGSTKVMAENFNNLKQMSTLLLVFVFAAGVLILFFVFLFWMKNRIHEIGVYLSLGKSKGRIITQILLEGLFIGIVAFAIASFSAPAISKGVTGYLVADQVRTVKQKEKEEEGMVASSGGESEEAAVVAVTTSITGKTTLISGMSVIGIIVLSISLSSVFILVQKPRQILSKMS